MEIILKSEIELAIINFMLISDLLNDKEGEE
jgi:hypothetical protein